MLRSYVSDAYCDLECGLSSGVLGIAGLDDGMRVLYNCAVCFQSDLNTKLNILS